MGLRALALCSRLGKMSELQRSPRLARLRVTKMWLVRTFLHSGRLDSGDLVARSVFGVVLKCFYSRLEECLWVSSRSGLKECFALFQVSGQELNPSLSLQ